jgi:hypothetical protein
MKNPIEILKKELKLHSEMHGKLAKLKKKFDKEVDIIGKKFSKELTKLEKQAAKKKVKIEDQLSVWKKGGYEGLVNKLRKSTDTVMQEIRKDYKLAVDKLKK